MLLIQELLIMMSIEDRTNSLAKAILEDAEFTPAQAEAILTIIRLMLEKTPPQLPAKILRFN